MRDSEYVLRYPPSAGVLVGEMCPPGTAARLRRMERIAKKYRRRFADKAGESWALGWMVDAWVAEEMRDALADILSA